MNSTNATVNVYSLITSEKYDELLDKWENQCFSSSDKRVINYLRSNKKKLIKKTYLAPKYVRSETDQSIAMSIFENIHSLITVISRIDRGLFKIPMDDLEATKWLYKNKDEVYFIEEPMIAG